MMLSLAVFESVKAQLIRLVRSSDEARAAFRRFADEMLAAVYGDPVLLRAYGRRQAKKVRRGIGRKIRRLEGARVCDA